MEENEARKLFKGGNVSLLPKDLLKFKRKEVGDARSKFWVENASEVRVSADHEALARYLDTMRMQPASWSPYNSDAYRPTIGGTFK